MGLRDRLVKGPNALPKTDSTISGVHREETHYVPSEPGSHGTHPLLRKSPWVERAESNSLPAKELKP